MKKEIIEETIKMVGDSILVLDDGKPITPEHFHMPVEYALDRYKEEMTVKIDEYCKMKCPSSYDLFKLFAEITGFKIERFHDALHAKDNKVAFVKKSDLIDIAKKIRKDEDAEHAEGEQ